MSAGSTTSCKSFPPSTRLKDLPLKETNQVIKILNRNNCWKELAGVITHPDNSEELLFSADSIGVLESQWKTDSSPGEALFGDWSTYGKAQPCLSDLVKFLKVAELHRAAADIQNNLLKDYIEDNDDGNTLKPVPKEESPYPEVEIVEALAGIDLEDMTLFSYHDLQLATKNFSDRSLEEDGSKIGEGAFGCVYRGVFDIDGEAFDVAVKRLRDPVDKQFITEIQILTRFRHENLLPLLGCSFNGPTCCLVYQYMPNGSLQDRLARLGGSPVIPWTIRICIAYGAALGINHLHTFGDQPMVHRDIKSANILLDNNFVPKVGDFGLVRIGGSSNSTTMAVTLNVIGTSIYMAREAFCGDVSVKLDSFSFGVVLLELLTGLPPLDVTREDRDLVTHVENCDDILLILDPQTDWNTEAALELYQISKLCLSDSKRARPAIAEILEDLKKCLIYIDED